MKGGDEENRYVKEFRKAFIKDTLENIAITIGLLALAIATSMIPFESKDIKYIFNFLVGLIAGMSVGLLWLEWLHKWR